MRIRKSKNRKHTHKTKDRNVYDIVATKNVK